MSANKVNKIVKELFIFVTIVFILLLSATNLENFQKPKRVLGIETQVVSDDKFWEEFLSKNPNYIPGWLETGRIDKVKEIDPNYELVSGN